MNKNDSNSETPTIVWSLECTWLFLPHFEVLSSCEAAQVFRKLMEWQLKYRTWSLDLLCFCAFCFSFFCLNFSTSSHNHSCRCRCVVFFFFFKKKTLSLLGSHVAQSQAIVNLFTLQYTVKRETYLNIFSFLKF